MSKHYQGTGDYKTGYSSSSQGSSKQGVGSNQGSMNSSVAELPYKSHLAKVGISSLYYDSLIT
jgi:hypothetical protein